LLPGPASASTRRPEAISDAAAATAAAAFCINRHADVPLAMERRSASAISPGDSTSAWSIMNRNCAFDQELGNFDRSPESASPAPCPASHQKPDFPPDALFALGTLHA
jgi:hypothetical protein